ncbi:MAG: DnaB-like helicase C-terminal domain-containing protein [Dermatophilaceae bacterium]
MSQTPRDTPAHRESRRRSVQNLLDETDAALRRGARAGSTVWPTGFDLLDSALGGGFRSGELILLAGGESAGKTTFAMQMARGAVVAGRRALVFSYEHDAHTLLQRLLALEAAYAADDCLTPGEHPADVSTIRSVFEADQPDRRGLSRSLGGLSFGSAALEAMHGWAERLDVFQGDSQLTGRDIAAAVAAEVESTGQAPIVVVDYLQKVPIKGYYGDEASRVTQITETLKDAALELGCPIVAVTAADRAGLGAGRRMRTSDLRGSSALAYEADVVLVLASKENVVAREHLIYDVGSLARFRRWSVVSIEKNRHGMSGIELELEKDFEHARFRPNDQPVAERLIEERVAAQ